ncbi:23S rRNA (guanosine(2251)-2'-O)-methyltransferase RlmB [Maricaulis sp.]|uniref:23S rRNA (guanosine(2251)-2'-O)-methyltransferase RlmB n=1 Tax=Maricaulis sp. TaxID=1486257 RepID=UPI002613045B|nr:23S rRNA (guanosine(2251)-2'-O)-methyltransferase RlmB [Maricaulis sp.]
MTKNPRRNSPKRPDYSRRSRPSGAGETGWIWGRHAVLAALSNPRREILRIRVTRNAARDLPDGSAAEIVEPQAIDHDLPAGAVHQGFAVQVRALAPEPVSAVTDPTHGALLVLDQITDPHNVGAILRSAAAFGVRAAVMQDRKAPPLFGTVCKSAVGAAERVAHVRVVNIANTLADFRKAGRFVLGLAGEAEVGIAQALAGPDGQGLGPGVVLVMGSEDKGLRPRVAEACDRLVRIPMTGAVESLNVSNAAAIALYEAAKWRPAGSRAPD